MDYKLKTNAVMVSELEAGDCFIDASDPPQTAPVYMVLNKTSALYDSKFELVDLQTGHRHFHSDFEVNKVLPSLTFEIA
jgi:hypothetical protein